MSKATNGQQMQLEQALRLLDIDGEPIKWEKAEDGSYGARKEKKGAKVKDAEGKDKQLPGNIYIYSITPQTTIVDVGVIEHVEGSPEEGPLTGDEAKKADEAVKAEAKKSEEALKVEDNSSKSSSKSSKKY